VKLNWKQCHKTCCVTHFNFQRSQEDAADVCCVTHLWKCVTQAEDAERREKNLLEAKKIVLEEDESLPKPVTVSTTSDSCSMSLGTGHLTCWHTFQRRQIFCIILPHLVHHQSPCCLIGDTVGVKLLVIIMEHHDSKDSWKG